MYAYDVYLEYMCRVFAEGARNNLRTNKGKFSQILVYVFLKI
jgi:hypothetical protein